MRVHAMLTEGLRNVQLSGELPTCDREDETVEQRLDSKRGVWRWFPYGVMSLN